MGIVAGTVILLVGAIAKSKVIAVVGFVLAIASLVFEVAAAA